MATPNIVPNANNEGKLGKSGTQWQEVRAQSIYQNGVQVASLSSPAFTGNPTAPTQSTGDNSTRIATTNWVRTLISNGQYMFINGAANSGNIYAYDGYGFADTGYTAENFLDLGQHTGTLNPSSVDATGEWGGTESTLTEEIASIRSEMDDANAEIANKANITHTHFSSAITDADSTVGASNTIVKRNTSGGILGKNQASSGSAIKGDNTGSGGFGVQGTNTNSTGSAGYFTSDATTNPGSAITGIANVGSNCPVATLVQRGTGTYLEAKTNTGAGDSKFRIDSATNMVWLTVGGTAFSKTLAVGSATANRTATLPNATGTIVLGDGSGITDASAFRNAIGAGSSSNIEFATVSVTASTTDGLRFGSAKLALSNIGNAAVFKLPNVASGTSTLVSGDGVGITDSTAFVAALGLTPSSNPTYTTVEVASSTTTGYKFSSGAKIALTNTGSNAVYKLPNIATGNVNIVAGDGTGVDASSFRTAIGLSSSNNVTFTTAQVTASTTDGIRFGGAKLAMTNTGNAATFKLPDVASGSATLVSGDGTGITDAAAFKTALGITSTNDPTFTTVQVASSTTTGYKFSSGAKLCLASNTDTSIFQLPNGSGAITSLVSGSGLGITSASSFRTAIGTVAKTGDTFTGLVIIDPASGNNMLQMIGDAGISTTITCNASSSTKTIAIPNANGTFVVTSSGSIAPTDITGSTATGQSLITAANAAAARTAINAKNGTDIGYYYGYIATSDITYTNSGDEELIAAGVLSSVDSLNFSQYTAGVLDVAFSSSGVTNKKFYVSICSTVANAGAGNEIAIRIGKNGVAIASSEITMLYHHTSGEHAQINTQAIVTLDNGDRVTFHAEDLDASAADMTFEKAIIIIKPID